MTDRQPRATQRRHDPYAAATATVRLVQDDPVASTTAPDSSAASFRTLATASATAAEWGVPVDIADGGPSVSATESGSPPHRSASHSSQEDRTAAVATTTDRPASFFHHDTNSSSSNPMAADAAAYQMVDERITQPLSSPFQQNTTTTRGGGDHLHHQAASASYPSGPGDRGVSATDRGAADDDTPAASLMAIPEGMPFAGMPYQAAMYAEQMRQLMAAEGYGMMTVLDGGDEAAFHHHQQLRHNSAPHHQAPVFDADGNMIAPAGGAVPQTLVGEEDAETSAAGPPAYERALFDLKREGEELPAPAATMANKIERKRRQRKRRVERKRERERARKLAAAAADGNDGGDGEQERRPHGSSNDASASDGDSASCYSGSDDDDDGAARQIPVVAAPSRHATTATCTTSASTGRRVGGSQYVPSRRDDHADSCSEDDDDAGCVVVPIVTRTSPTTAQPPAMPRPRSHTSLAQSPCIVTPAPLPVVAPPPPPEVKKPAAQKKPAKTEWQVVGGKAATKATKPAAPKAATATSKSTPATGSAATSPAAVHNPFALLSSSKGGSAPASKKSQQQQRESTTAAVSDKGSSPPAPSATKASDEAAAPPQPSQEQQHSVAVVDDTTPLQQHTTSSEAAPLPHAGGSEHAPPLATTTAAAQPPSKTTTAPKKAAATSGAAKEKKPSAGTSTSTKKKATSGGGGADDEFEAVLAQLEAATSGRGAAAGSTKKQRGGSGANGKTTSDVAVLDDDIGTVDDIEALAGSSGLAAAAASAMRRAQRMALSAPHLVVNALERCCSPAAGPRLQMLARIELAEISNELQDGEQAVLHAMAALALAGAVDDDAIEAKALLRLAKGHEATGDAHPALEALRRALSTMPDLQSRPRFTAHCLTCYGCVADLAGQAVVATRCLDAADHLAQQAGDRRLRIEIVGHKAASVIAHGEYDQAIKLLEPHCGVKKPSTSPTRDPTTLMRMLPTLAQAYYSTGSDEWRSLLEHHGERLVAAGDVLAAGTCFGLLGTLWRAEDEPKVALGWTLKELGLLAPPQFQFRRCEPLNNAGSCYTALGMHDRARMQHARELESAKASGDAVSEAKAIIAKAYVELNDKNARGALKDAMSAMSILDSVPQRQRDRYIVRVACYEAEWKQLDLLEAIHVSNGTAKLALRAADHKHVAELQPLLCGFAPRLKNALCPSSALTTCAAHGVDLVVSYSFTWNDASTDLNVYAAHPHTGVVSLKTIPIPVRSMALLVADNSNFRRAVARAPLDTVLLMHRLGRLVEQAARGDLKADLELDCPAEDGGVPDLWLQWLYEDLIAPVEAHLAPLALTSRIVFVADGFLAAVPWLALRSSPSQPCLANRFVVSTTPSLEVLEVLCKRDQPPVRDAVYRVEAPSSTGSAAVDALCDEAVRGAESRVAAVAWDVRLESTEPYVGSVVAAGVVSDTPPALKAVTGEEPCAVPMFDLCNAFVKRRKAATAAAAAATNDSTAVLLGMTGTTNRIGHDVSIPPHFAVFLLGFSRAVRALSPAALPVLKSLADSPRWGSSGATPSAASLRDICLAMQQKGDNTWQWLVLAGAL